MEAKSYWVIINLFSVLKERKTKTKTTNKWKWERKGRERNGKVIENLCWNDFCHSTYINLKKKKKWKKQNFLPSSTRYDQGYRKIVKRRNMNKLGIKCKNTILSYWSIELREKERERILRRHKSLTKWRVSWIRMLKASNC